MELRRRLMGVMGGGEPAHPYPDPWEDDGKVWAYYEVTDTSAATTLLYNTGSISAMEVDGQAVTLATKYTFATIGEHLVKFTLSDTTKIGDGGSGTFRSCNNLRRLYMPDTVTEVKRITFYQNTGMTQLFLSPNITTLCEQAFAGCSAAMDVNLPYLTSIGKSVFSSSGVKTIKNLGSITALVSSEIRQAQSLTDLVLPDTLTSVGDASIWYCAALKHVTCLATTPPSANSNMLYYCNALEWIKVPSNSVAAYKAASRWSSFANKIISI